MKEKKLIICIIAVVLVIGIGLGIYFFTKGNSKNDAKTTTENFVAYIKINPSVKLDYSQTCQEFADGKKECNEPIVNNYELINSDAKEIFKDVDLLAGEKELAAVIETICTKVEESGIKVENVDIQSDWDGLNNYLENETISKKAEIENNTESDSKVTENTTSYVYTVSVEQEQKIESDINNDTQEEAKAIEEARIAAEAKAQAEKEAKEKAEAEAKAKAAQTIYLKDNVTYVVGGKGYCCEGCFSTALINSFKNAKGYYLTSGTADRIDYQKVVRLSDPYNKTTYYGNDLESKLIAAGAEECGGLGGGPESLTKEICKQFHLICE